MTFEVTNVTRSTFRESRSRAAVRAVAKNLYDMHASHTRHLSHTSPRLHGSNAIKLVCISDTHNSQPSLPEGDILIHAGDLTQQGTYSELQTQLDWLTSQPHETKVLIAGNHDRLLDHTFVVNDLNYLPAKDPPASALNLHNLVYLGPSHTDTIEEDNHVVTITVRSQSGRSRQLKIYGTPLTPSSGNFAFQKYPPIRDVWRDCIPPDTDIVITHGPATGHLSGRFGCLHLLREIHRVQPRVHVFGHIHEARGREAVVLDGARQAWEKIEYGGEGWRALGRLVVEVGIGLLWWLLGMHSDQRVTEFVNAACYQGEGAITVII